MGTLLALAVAMTSLCCVNVFADDNGKIDYSQYDEDLIYVQEHADWVEAYNARVLASKNSVESLRLTYTPWNWSNGIFSRTFLSGMFGADIPYSFEAVNSYMYFSSYITAPENAAPTLSINILNSDGTLNYQGTKPIPYVEDGVYMWDNQRVSLVSGKDYVFGLWASTSWQTAYIDIYYKAM